MRHCEKKHIKNQSRRISEEKLNFKNGIALGDVDIFIDGGKTRSMSEGLSRRGWPRSTGRLLEEGATTMTDTGPAIMYLTT